MQNNDTWLPLTGRILLALIFVLSGASKIPGFADTAQYMAAQGLPWPQLLLPVVILVELAGGLFLVVGWQARLAATGLLVFTAIATVTFHDFWAAPAAEALMQQVMFMKNLSMMGGLLLVLAYGPGRWSLGQRTAAA